MTATITIAPVRKTLRVRASQAHAFEVFTAGLASWWPSTHGIGEGPMERPVFEPRLGGRWYELGKDGAEAEVGQVLLWEPPERFVVSWNIDSRWKPAKIGSEVEVRFIAEGEETRVELEHRKFEVMGEEGGRKMRSDVDGGWPHILDLFKQSAEGAAS
jgi:uncharacterized protein YndB with AHSA1/START domain